MRRRLTTTGQAAWALVAIQLAMWALVATHGAGKTPAIDEACYIHWAQSDAPISQWPEFLAPKVLTSWLVRILVHLYGDGMAGFLALKASFVVFSLAAVAGVFWWRRVVGDRARDAFICAAVVATTPWFLNATGRVLSELPAIALVVWGMFATALAERSADERGGRAPRTWMASAAALACFLLSVGARSTAFAAVGAFLGYRVLARFLSGGPAEGEQQTFTDRMRRTWIPVIIAVMFGAVLLTWPLLFEYPHMPWGLVRSSITHFRRPPEATVAALFFGGGVWVFSAFALMVMAACLGTLKRKDVAEWAWLLAAASPFIAITQMGGEVLPRHAGDLAVPLGVVTAIMARRVAELRDRPSTIRLLVMVGILTVVSTLWRHMHAVGSHWSGWFTHGALDGRRFAIWAAAAIVATTGVAMAFRPRLGLRRLTVAGMFGVGVVHCWLALSGIRTDCCTVSPQMLRDEFVRIGVDREQDVIVLPLANYECDILRFTMPEWPLLLLDFPNGLSQTSDAPNGTVRWAAIPRHYTFDDQELVQKMIEMAGPGASATEVGGAGQVMILRLDAAR